MSKPTVWFSGDAHEWWIDDIDPLTAARKVEQHPDAVNVTNAWDILDTMYLDRLMVQAGRVPWPTKHD